MDVVGILTPQGDKHESYPMLKGPVHDNQLLDALWKQREETSMLTKIPSHKAYSIQQQVRRKEHLCVSIQISAILQ